MTTYGLNNYLQNVALLPLNMHKYECFGLKCNIFTQKTKLLYPKNSLITCILKPLILLILKYKT